MNSPYREEAKAPYVVRVWACPYKMEYKEEELYWNDFFESKINDMWKKGFSLVSFSMSNISYATNQLDPRPENEKCQHYGYQFSCVFNKF